MAPRIDLTVGRHKKNKPNSFWAASMEEGENAAPTMVDLTPLVRTPPVSIKNLPLLVLFPDLVLIADMLPVLKEYSNVAYHIEL